MLRDGVLIFNSVHKVMKAEKVLKGANLDVRIMPVPRQLSSDCGLSISFRLADRKSAEALLDEAGVPPEKIFRSEGDSFSPVADRCRG